LTSLIILFEYAFIIAYSGLDVGAVYYALKLGKITGLFRGWLFMIAALILISVSGLISLVEYVFVFPGSQLEALVQQWGNDHLLRFERDRNRHSNSFVPLNVRTLQDFQET
jgi:hypothetical protein